VGLFQVRGANSYAGGTVIDDVSVTPLSAMAFSSGTVTVRDGGQVDLTSSLTCRIISVITGNGWTDYFRYERRVKAGSISHDAERECDARRQCEDLCLRNERRERRR